MKCIRTKNGEVYNLESKEASSWEYIDNDTAINEYGVEGAFYTIYYFDENKGHYSEHDGKGGHSCVFIDEKDILKQVDSIEGLCDEFVYDKQGYEIPQRCYQNYCGDWFDEQSIERLTDKEISTVKGGVWTDKGFLYVAKMDDKRSLSSDDIRRII